MADCYCCSSYRVGHLVGRGGPTAPVHLAVEQSKRGNRRTHYDCDYDIHVAVSAAAAGTAYQPKIQCRYAPPALPTNTLTHSLDATFSSSIWLSQCVFDIPFYLFRLISLFAASVVTRFIAHRAHAVLVTTHTRACTYFQMYIIAGTESVANTRTIHTNTSQALTLTPDATMSSILFSLPNQFV